jgi:hypothetical protein
MVRSKGLSQKMIVGNLVTFPARGATLEGQIARILPQVDRLNICFNQYRELPRFLERMPKVYAVVPSHDLKAIGKYYFQAGRDDLVFLFDDDLPYPPDYVSRTIDLREWVLRNIHPDAVVGYHGSTYAFPGLTRLLYRAFVNRRDVIRQASVPGRTYDYHVAQDKFLRVAQLGTGTTCLRGDQVPPLKFFHGAERHDDVRFARWCHSVGFPQIILPRDQNWIGRGGDDEHSIWNSFTKKFPMRRSIEVFSYCFSVKDQGREWLRASDGNRYITKD